MKTQNKPTADSRATVSFALCLCMLLLAFGSFAGVPLAVSALGQVFWFTCGLSQLVLATAFATEAIVRN